MSSQGGTSKSNTPTFTSTPLTPHDSASATASPLFSLSRGSASATSGSTSASDVAMESVETPLQEQASDFNQNLDWSSGKPESNKDIAAVQRDSQETAATPATGGGLSCTHHSLIGVISSSHASLMSPSLLVEPDDAADSLERSDVQAIIESTPELDMDLESCRGTRYQVFDEICCQCQRMVIVPY